MGSIGEYGIDAAGDVKDPATDTDFMGYCGNNWVSPYTYIGLMNAFPTTGGGFSPIAATRFGLTKRREDTERATRPFEQLFVNLRIRGANRKVTLSPMFHYEARPVPPRGKPTRYRVELRDSHDNALVSTLLSCTDHHGCNSGTGLSAFQPVAWPDGVTRLVVLCDEAGCGTTELHSADVPAEPPEIEHISVDASRDRVYVSWTPVQTEDCLWYLVQYSCDGGATWRNVAPHTRDTSVTISRLSLAGGKECVFRVLASSGIRTGYAVSEPISISPERRPSSTS